jgi:hypothetical protein
MMAGYKFSSPAILSLRLRGGEAESQTYDSKEAEKFDQALWSILSQHPDEIHFLNTVFNFLQRRTPCFVGPTAERNYQILIDTLSRQKDVYLDHVKKGVKLREPVPMPDPGTQKAQAAPASTAPSVRPAPRPATATTSAPSTSSSDNTGSKAVVTSSAKTPQNTTSKQVTSHAHPH